MDNFFKETPISRTIVASAAAVLVLANLNIIPPHKFVFLPEKVFAFPPELWRVVTAFLLPGMGWQHLTNMYFFYIYLTGLESNSRFRRPGDMVYYLLLVTSAIVLVNCLLFKHVVFFQQLVTAALYTFSQLDPELSMSIGYVFSLKRRYMPWAMLAYSFAFEGEYAMMTQVAAYLIAALFEFLAVTLPAQRGGRSLLTTPEIIHFHLDSLIPPDDPAGGSGPMNGRRPTRPGAAGHSTNWAGPGRTLGGA